MKDLLTSCRAVALQLLLGCGTSALAQSLGLATADAWIGRPLEVTVPARFSSSDAADECVHADVFYGDTRVRGDRVRTTVTGPLLQRKIRIEVGAPVDEPVVTVSVRAGCQGPITRSYTLLPALPSAAMLAAESGRPAGASRAARLTPAPMATRRAASRPAAEAGRAKRVASDKRPEAAIDRAAPRARGEHASRATSRETSTGPRLRLEPLDVEPQATLRVSATLSQPTNDAARRAAAALLWQAIHADPQEILKTSAMLHKLEGDVAQLRQANGETRAEMATLRQRLDTPEPWHRSMPLVQLLGILLLGVTMVAAILWRRGRRRDVSQAAWYAPVQPALDSQFEPAGQAVARTCMPLPVTSAVPPAPKPPTVPAAVTDSQPPVPLPEVHPVALEDSAQAGEARPHSATQGALRVETLAATFQEVEFMAALGVPRDAVDVLEAYLSGSASPAPLAFFELMRLYDRDQNAAALDGLRTRYRELFGQEAPPLEQVTAAVGVDGLSRLGERISRAWGTVDALEAIEHSLFATPSAACVLTLQAGRDLLSLYDLALAIGTESSPCAAAEADAHPIAPWAHAEDASHARLALQSAGEAAGGLSFALDVDLSAPPPRAEGPAAPSLELEPLLAEFEAQAAHDAAVRAVAEQEDAFSAAVASERMPASRY